MEDSLTSTCSDARCVRFSEKITVINNRKRVTLSPKELASCFYSQDEFERMKEEILTTYMNFEPSKDNRDDENYTARGLEDYYIRNLKSIQAKERSHLKKAMKKEQTNQKHLRCYPDMERFRNVSRDVSKEAKVRARTLGLQDAKESQRIQKMNPLPLSRGGKARCSSFVGANNGKQERNGRQERRSSLAGFLSWVR